MLSRTLLLFCILFCLGAAQELQEQEETKKPKSNVAVGWIIVGVSASCFTSVFFVFLPSILYYKYFKKDVVDDTRTTGLH